MKSSLLFNFDVDKSTNSITIKREFAAEQSLVWDTFTKKDLLDQWWAPAPWYSKTTHMNFEVGGKRVYAMCSPDGDEHWAVQWFTSITAITNFQFEDAFEQRLVARQIIISEKPINGPRIDLPLHSRVHKQRLYFRSE